MAGENGTRGWIGVDLDGCLAEYHGWKGDFEFGQPIQPMVEFVKKTLEAGEYDVRIMTARANDGPEVVSAIQDWLEAAGLPRLAVTATKDFKMVMLYDDRAVTVELNTGRLGSEVLAEWQRRAAFNRSCALCGGTWTQEAEDRAANLGSRT